MLWRVQSIVLRFVQSYKTILIFLLLFSLSNPAFAGYSYYRSITVQVGGGGVYNGSGATTLTQFPILVCGNASSGACTATVSNMKTVGNGGHILNTVVVNGQTVPADLIFTTDSGCSNLLTWEVENYSVSTGEFEAWVTNTSTPLSYTANTTFYMCYGNTAITSFQGGSIGAVWDSNYLGVWHLPNGSTLSANDSTGHGNNGTLQGSPTATSGEIDGAANLAESSSQYISTASHSIPSAITVSGWIKVTSFINTYEGIIGPDNSTNFAILLLKSNGKLAPYVVANSEVDYDGTGLNTLSAGTWYYLVMTYNSTNGLIGYVNNSQDGTVAANGTLNTTAATMDLGNDAGFSPRIFNGVINEMRESSIARPAAWIYTEYNNQSAPSSFYTMGSESGSTHQDIIGGNSTLGGNSTIY